MTLIYSMFGVIGLAAFAMALFLATKLETGGDGKQTGRPKPPTFDLLRSETPD